MKKNTALYSEQLTDDGRAITRSLQVADNVICEETCPLRAKTALSEIGRLIVNLELNKHKEAPEVDMKEYNNYKELDSASKV